MKIDLNELMEEFSNNLKLDYDLKKKNWFNIGGKTKAFYKADNLKELIKFLQKIQNKEIEKEEKIQKEVKKEKPKTNGNIVTSQPLKQIKKVFAEPASKDDIDPLETNEWIESLNSVIENDGSSRASYLLNKVIDQAYKAGLVLPDTRTTPYINTIPPETEVKSPGDQNIEKKIIKFTPRANFANMVLSSTRTIEAF